MPKMFLKGFLTAILVIFCYASFAQTAPATHQSVETTSTFNVTQANRVLDKLSIQLSIENLNINNLQSAADQLTQLQEKAKECVSKSQTQIDKMNGLWEEAKTGSIASKELTPLQKYLQEKKETLRHRQSACRLFVLRSDEAITAFMKTVKKLSTKELLTVKPSFWSSLLSSVKTLKDLPSQFNSKNFYRQSGIDAFKKTSAIITLVSIILISLIIGFLLNRFLTRRIESLKLVETFSDKLRLAFFSTVKKYSIICIILCLLIIEFDILNLSINPTNYLSTVGYLLLGFFLLLAFLHFFFNPFRSLQPICSLSETVAKPLLNRLKFLAALCLLGSIIYVFTQNQNFSPAALSLGHTVFITLLSINIISILLLINRFPKILQYHPILRFFIGTILIVGLIALILAEWLGYQQLVTYILTSITLTLFFGFIAWLLHKICVGTLHAITHHQSPLPELLRNQLGATKHELLPEFVWLHIVFYIVIWGGFILVLLKVWKLSETHFRALIDILTEGFKVTNMHIVPLRILFGFIFFILCFMLVRWIRNTLEKGKNSEEINIGSRHAMAAIFAYVTNAIIILMALLIAGVNFAGLAIIAGALSVGIGFGLQNIVNNFLSGIILLIERPIKPGDRVVINNDEGFVRRIRLRYTQIRTLKFSDIIVPNSEIISKSLTNLMYHDLYGRIELSVGVAYGSDVDLVKKVLLEVANNHPEVIKDDPLRQPLVFFTEFGDSALKFDLYVVLRNINLKYIVRSELNIAIDKAFHEHNITIAFPQRDLHIKNWPGKLE